MDCADKKIYEDGTADQVFTCNTKLKVIEITVNTNNTFLETSREIVFEFNPSFYWLTVGYGEFWKNVGFYVERITSSGPKKVAIKEQLPWSSSQLLLDSEGNMSGLHFKLGEFDLIDYKF